MKKTLLSLMLAMVSMAGLMAETKTIIVDGSEFPTSATTEDMEFTCDDVTFVCSDGAKYQTSSGDNRFADKAILIGKTGKYIYNKTAIPGAITKFEIYANKGASTKVSVGVNFSASAISAFNATADNVYTALLSTVDNVYDCSEKLPTGARYFWFQVTNEYNAQVQFRITYETGEVNKAEVPTLTAEGTFVTESMDVTITNKEEGATVYYTTDGTEPTTASASFTEASKTIQISATTTVKAMAVKEGKENSRVTSATYTYAVFANLEALVAATVPDGGVVKVTLDKVVIKSMATKGIYFDIQKDGKDIEIYSASANVPDGWTQGGKVSGTIVAPWKKYNGTWELAPAADWSWSSLTYEAADKTPATLNFSVDKMEVGEVKTVAIEYNGDGALSVASDNEAVATAVIKDGKLEITALTAGSAKITVSAAETDNYQAKSYYRNVTVVEKFAAAAVPFAFDGGKNEATPDKGMTWVGLGSDYANSPKLKFDSSKDSLIVAIAESAAYVHFTIKGNSFKDGSFEVLESADGKEYSSLKKYTELAAAAEESLALKAETRYVLFTYTEKVEGNVALGDIKINNDAPTALKSVNASMSTGTRKGVYNGRIVIFQNGKMYSLTGQEIK